MEFVFPESRYRWKPVIHPFATSPLSGVLKGIYRLGSPGYLQNSRLSLSTDKQCLSMRLRIRSEIGWYHEAFSSLYKEQVSLCRDEKAFLFYKMLQKGGGRIESNHDGNRCSQTRIGC